MTTLPTKEQIEAAVLAIRRTHADFGYRRQLDEHYAEVLAWAAYFAIELNGAGQGALE